jgi:hypothetical protein
MSQQQHQPLTVTRIVTTVVGDDPGLIPDEACPHEPTRVRASVRITPAHPPPSSRGLLEKRITAYMARVPNLSEGQGRDNHLCHLAAWLTRDLGLSDEAALPWLERWDRGNVPPKGTERLRQIMASARRYGRHPIGTGQVS